MFFIKPINRSSLRIKCGKLYYTFKRYFQWYFNGTKYALNFGESKLPYIVFEHQSLLLRKLKDVDMWMQYNKIKNLELALKRINSVLIKPGETFSFWRLIGKPTRRKGYVDGMVLFSGRVFPGVGGGLCQLSNLIYWMTLHTPLKVVERHRHSYDVFPDTNRTQPFGSGATGFYNYGDLQIHNDTEQIYQLILHLTDTHLVGEWRSVSAPTRTYEVYQKKHWITHEPWGGYIRHNVIFRKSYNLNQEILDDQYVTENHAIMMYQPFLSKSGVPLENER